MAVNEHFELADMKSSNGFSLRLSWLQIPSWGAMTMKFLLGARLMLMQICVDHVIKAHCTLQRGISLIQKNHTSHFQIKRIFTGLFDGFFFKNLYQRCSRTFPGSEIPLRTPDVITMKCFNHIPVFADLCFAF